MKFKQQMVASAKLVMKITVVQILLCAISISALYAKEANAQNVLEKKITLNVKNAPLSSVVSLLKSQTQADFSLSYSDNALQPDMQISCNVKNETLQNFLNDELSSFDIAYRVVNDQVVLYKRMTAVNLPISGKVTDEKGGPLPGVTVKVKGSTLATSTNDRGQYTISVPAASDILVFSFIGYESQEVAVGNSKVINISLKEVPNNLNEVVVVAFGAQKKATVTGSLATITTKDLVQSPVANISNSLVGRMPGLFASQASGEPGADQSTLRIRGVSTFSGNTDPLVMVDGIETPNYNNIDPNEIESVSILKDASATAVYGIRGANGVLLITTKRGKKGAPRINYTFNEAVNRFTTLTQPMDAPTYAVDLNQALANDAYAASSNYVPRFTANDIQLYKSGTDPIFHPNINWYDVILKKYTTQQQHNLNVSGGTDKVKYFLSAGYFNQSGLFKDFSDLAGFNTNLDYNRINFRSNFDFQVNKRLKITIDASTQNEQRTGNNANTSTVIDNLGRANPMDADLPIDGKIVNNVANASNPIQGLISSGYKNQYSNYLNATVRLDHKLDFITEGLNLRTDVNYQNFNSITYLTTNNGPNGPLITYLAQALPGGGVSYLPSGDYGPFGFSSSQSKNRREVFEFGFDYDRTFGGHSITGLLLYRQSKLYDPTLAYLVPNGHQGAVGRVTYNFKNKYLAEVSAGYEGTENFAPGKRFGLFPAYSVGWVPSEESFFPKNNVVNFVKLRASYGQVGNDQIGGARFLYNPTTYTYGTAQGYYFGQIGSTYQQYQGAVAGTVGNPNLTWERSVKINAGLDMYMFNNSLTLTAEVFHEKRDNILEVPQTAALIPGYLPPAQNLGSMSNKGIEGSGTYKNNIGGFNYQLGGNISFARNKILFESEVPQTYSYRNVTGQRYGQYYGLVAQGLYNSWAEVNDPNRPVYYSNFKVQPGDIKFKDVNGDGVINDDDMVPIGYSNIPEITYGFSLRGSYKGIDFSVLFQGVGNVSVGYTRRVYNGFFDTPTAGAPSYLDQSWTAARYASGAPINFPRFTAVNGSGGNPNEEPSSMFIVNARYLRLKNVEIGYSFKPAFLKKIALKSARVYANANNLITWDNLLPGVDPENLPQGANFQSYPLVRTINLGLNIGF